MSIIILLDNTFNNKKIFIPILILFLIIAGVSTFTFTQDQMIFHDKYESNKDMLSILGENNIIISDEHNNFYKISLNYAPNNKFYLFNENLTNDTNKLLMENKTMNRLNNGSKIFVLDHYEENITTLNNSNFSVREIPFSNSNPYYSLDERNAPIPFRIFEIIISE